MPADLSTLAAAIDVGAAPGGWTACLAKAGVRRVVAVDPGALTIPDEPPYDTAVEHMQMTFEAALPQLVSAARTADADVRFGLYVCDMNQPPATALDFMLRSLPLLRPRAPFVLTFKNPFKKDAQWQQALGAALARLELVADGVTELHLFANTSHETTVVGTIKEPPPTAARAAVGHRRGAACLRELQGRGREQLQGAAGGDRHAERDGSRHATERRRAEPPRLCGGRTGGEGPGEQEEEEEGQGPQEGGRRRLVPGLRPRAEGRVWGYPRV